MTDTSFGVGPGMIAAYGDLVFELSSNIQIRRGDPVRRLDYDEVERQRPGTGMSDIEIARRLGLAEQQVRVIRMMEESRRFSVNEYRKLYGLGSGKRYREDRRAASEARFVIGDQAAALRHTLQFDAGQLRAFVEGGDWTGETVAGMLARWAGETPDRPAMIAGGQAVSYGETLERARRIAAGLASLGIGKGDPVAIQLANTPEYLLTYFALTLLGAVLVPLHVVYRAGDLEPLLRHSRARAVVCGPAAEDYDAPRVMTELADALPDLDVVIVAGAAGEGLVALDDLAQSPPLDDIANPPVAADPLILAFTSGTSASPKGVVATHQTALSALMNATPLLGLQPGDTILSVAAFTHMFGMMVVHWSLHVGGALLLLPQFRPDLYADLVETGRPDVLFTAPAHVAGCVQAGLFDGRDLTSVRSAIFSGAVCPPDLARRFDGMIVNGQVHQMYGMTEAMVMAFTRLDDPPEVRHHACGRVVPGQALRVVAPETGEVLGAGEEGEIQVSGCSVLASYLSNPGATEAAFADGRWFRTGDLGTLDGDGNVRIVGRIKDVINRGGVKINPTDVEALIEAHPKVVNAAIVAMPDPRLGEKACCFATVAPDETLTLDDLCAWLSEHRIAKQKWPERLVVVDDLPMTPTRKIIKGRLRIPD